MAPIEDYAKLYPICSAFCEHVMGDCQTSTLHNLVNLAHYALERERLNSLIKIHSDLSAR